MIFSKASIEVVRQRLMAMDDIIMDQFERIEAADCYKLCSETLEQLTAMVDEYAQRTAAANQDSTSASPSRRRRSRSRSPIRGSGRTGFHPMPSTSATSSHSSGKHLSRTTQSRSGYRSLPGSPVRSPLRDKKKKTQSLPASPLRGPNRLFPELEGFVGVEHSPDEDEIVMELEPIVRLGSLVPLNSVNHQEQHAHVVDEVLLEESGRGQREERECTGIGWRRWRCRSKTTLC